MYMGFILPTPYRELLTGRNVFKNIKMQSGSLLRDADLFLALENASGPLSTMADKCAIPFGKGMIDRAVSLLSCWVALKETCCNAVECHHSVLQQDM